MTTVNPGSALGEAIGAWMEVALNVFIKLYVADFACHYFHNGPVNSTTRKPTKLLLIDKYGTAFNIDGVITNQTKHPLILVECKYIRYTKHNRDKGSWICTAHTSIRKTYNSVRSSIAVLAGNWSKTSLAMMKSNDINVFVIPFNKITELLGEHGIVFNWGEKERDLAVKS